jgi:hypothetical protein
VDRGKQLNVASEIPDEVARQSAARAGVGVNLPHPEIARRPDAQVGVVGDLEGATASALGQAAPGVGPAAPGDTPEEELHVVRARFLAEDLALLLLQAPGGHPAQALDLFAGAGGIDGGFLLGVGRSCAAVNQWHTIRAETVRNGLR